MQFCHLICNAAIDGVEKILEAIKPSEKALLQYFLAIAIFFIFRGFFSLWGSNRAVKHLIS